MVTDVIGMFDCMRMSSSLEDTPGGVFGGGRGGPTGKGGGEMSGLSPNYRGDAIL